jgi:hypothetical protein
MSRHELREKTFPVREGEGIDDVCLKIRSLTALPFAIESILITKTALKVMVWHEVDQDPMTSDIPHESPQSVDSMLRDIKILEIEPGTETLLNMSALASIVDMLLTARGQDMSGLSWLVGDPVLFCRWIGIKPTPIRFLELPLLGHSTFPDNKVMLLCGASAAHGPLEAKVGVVTTIVMEDQDAEV